jgi:hypothetical protein
VSMAAKFKVIQRFYEETQNSEFAICRLDENDRPLEKAVARKSLDELASICHREGIEINSTNDIRTIASPRLMDSYIALPLDEREMEKFVEVYKSATKPSDRYSPAA